MLEAARVPLTVLVVRYCDHAVLGPGALCLCTPGITATNEPTAHDSCTSSASSHGCISAASSPALLQVAMVTGILTYKCGPELAALTVGTIAAYTAFTFSVTQWRTQFRWGARCKQAIGPVLCSQLAVTGRGSCSVRQGGWGAWGGVGVMLARCAVLHLRWYRTCTTPVPRMH